MAPKTDANDNQRQAFTREAMIHLDHLFRVAYHLARQPDAVQDLVQDTFVRALDSYEIFNPPTNMRAWLTKILRNIFLDRYRKQRRWAPNTAAPPQREALWQEGKGRADEPEDLLLHKELSDKINYSLQMLPEEYRLPIVLVDMSEFSYAEAAETLCCPLGTIRSRLSRGRRLLQSYLTEYIDPTNEKQNDELRESRRTHYRPR